MNEIKSFLKLAHTKYWVGAHPICRDDDVTADQIKVSLAVAKHVDLVRFQRNEALIDDTLMQRAQATWLLPLHLRVDPDRAVVTAALQKINGSEDGHVAPEAWCEIGNNPVNVQ